ncbi:MULTISPECIES: sn-glycerol-3-phosphate ABC transporter ATP-binding protein UgpC [unclassified Mesorhizobium]|uniref:ABC transporter ATP-binding protein n=1 Tax=unclassified Mesorhizobium TaxID=325217 RepID=UPI00112B444F|nr:MULTISPECIES: sn-glycerol-3-phosphate ABC transporter ATP-binding protein UgpC [unclassified Mesorhizobium]TPM93760.1 sn-glycerol-3-phosphate ABC transporter ATP-binding protein UgpC [Mesorhizobium sp. B2-1-3A]BCG90101.1 sugar ABC transporter ATP-binding protein [Mesorhizobium sp. 113-3-9]
MSSLRIDGVKKSFGNVTVLHKVSLDISDGEFVVLVGPSGCGKSTLLRMIAGLEDLSEGQIRIGDRVINDLPPKSRNIAMVFQNYALYPHKTVRENMEFSLKIKKMPAGEIASRVARAAEILGLQELLERTPKQLSGGQRQRVAMGRAIVRDPAVFLFDEPLSNLDAQLRVAMRTEIKELHQRLRTTTVYVTHDQIEAMTMADRIVVMRQGVIEQIGAPLELYDRPQNLFVASFIGSPGMNFLKGKVSHDEPASFIAQDGTRLPLSPSAGSMSRAPAIYSVRPEHLAFDPSGKLSLEVVVVEPTGSETQIIGKLAGQNVICATRERLTVGPGSILPISISLQNVHLFDEATGERLN